MRSWGAEMQELGSTLEGAGDNMGELFENTVLTNQNSKTDF